LITAAALDLQLTLLVRKCWRYLKRRDGFKTIKKMVGYPEAKSRWKISKGDERPRISRP